MVSLPLDLASALDPAMLAFRAWRSKPDGWQVQVLRSRSRRLLMCVSRQAGKSSTAAVLAVHRALYRAPSLILCLSPSLRQSGELFRKVLNVYRATGQMEPPDSETLLRLELANGSRILSLPGSEQTIRGFSAVDMLLIDEAARVSDPLYHSVRPMLATSAGQLVLMSTPYGEVGFFHDALTQGTEWERITVTADQCPRIAPAFLAEERRVLGEVVFLQEYYCVPAANNYSVFDPSTVRAALDPTIVPFRQRQEVPGA